MRSLVICVMPNCSVSQQRSHQSWYLADCIALQCALCSLSTAVLLIAGLNMQLYMHDHTHPILMNRYVLNITVEQSAFSTVFSVRPEQNILHCIACVVLFCIGVLVRLDGGQRIVLFPEQNILRSMYWSETHCSIGPEEKYCITCVVLLGRLDGGTAAAQAVVIHLWSHDSPHLWITLTSPQ